MIFGGLQSIEGVLIAGPIIGILEYLAGGYIDPIVGGGLKDIFPYIIMMFALIIRPSGLFGWKIIERI
jgi:branched-chain amino acid transport system permease protein